MKNLIVAMAVLVTGLVTAQKSSLEIEMKGFKNNDGVVIVGLYNSEGKFLKTTCKGKKSHLKNKKANVIFEGLEKGEYAVMIYQDENLNGKLDSNFMGIPTEDYMASNDSKGFMGPPKYINAKFLVANNSKIVININ
ncbi:DUF2141 domain-containing protein [Flavobacterium sp.]|uniref:DUF2141 domain-containing protein n=1 Tax=Flavobacterium sp. TaxID=239 RepID=UPI00286BA2CF|nr:DUF2141 domain-containing protein [Flavobacterium sp.]